MTDQSELAASTSDTGIRCRAKLTGTDRLCGASPKSDNPNVCENNHFLPANKKAGVSATRYLAERLRDIEKAVDEFLRSQLGWANPADAPLVTRKEATRAERLDILGERQLNANRAEQFDKLADRAASIRQKLLNDPMHRPSPRLDARPVGGESRPETDRAFVRRRLLDVIATGTDAAVVSAAREFFERFGDNCEPLDTTGYLQLEARSELELDVLLWRGERPDDDRPVGEIVAAIIERQRADREAIAEVQRRFEPPASVAVPAAMTPVRPIANDQKTHVDSVDESWTSRTSRPEPTEAQIRACLRGLGDAVLADFETGRLERADAVSMTRGWLRQNGELTRGQWRGNGDLS